MYMRRKAQMYRARDKKAAALLREQAYTLEFDLHWLQNNRLKRPTTAAESKSARSSERYMASTRLHAKDDALAINDSLRHQIRDNATAIESMLSQVHARDAAHFHDVNPPPEQASLKVEEFRREMAISPRTRVHLPPLRQALAGQVRPLLPPPQQLCQPYRQHRPVLHRSPSHHSPHAALSHIHAADSMYQLHQANGYPSWRPQSENYLTSQYSSYQPLA
ncbi:hypothetical protein DYB26_013925 [Aphanomyces astaci]|uniref:Uncharacterized protein n=1 Tax=Aphanomyces astaci TaxID=112090 RepID=A0A397AE50_APHAT|nr:hypothetical protein DYB36_008722 [Aphanomyces astaci]RHZ12141.1 hypothetical protein DYB26_013925 [Aphanomyces astaci]